MFTEKTLVRRRLSLDRSCLVAGDIPIVLGALKQLGVPLPVPDDDRSIYADLILTRWTELVSGGTVAA